MTNTISRRNLITGSLAVGATLALTPLESASAADSGGRFVANFAYPHRTQGANENMFRQMNTDAISFGGTLKPYDSSDGIPWEILRRVQGKRIFFYTNPLTWLGQSAGPGHYYQNVNGTWWDIVYTWNNSVVISKNTGLEPNYYLIEAAKRTGYRAYIGLPKPRMGRNAGVADDSYLDVYESFCEKFVDNYNRRGASGFYHTLEITLSDNKSYWQPSWNTYFAAQKAIRHMSGHGKTAIFAPYIESRSNKGAAKTPAQVAEACKSFWGLTYGTNLVVAPQDGLGTGTTSLYADGRGGYLAKTEDYFYAMRNVLGRSLYATTECMTPGGGTASTRGITTKSRVSQQLWAIGKYTQGSIGYMWNGNTGMMNVPGLGNSWSAGSGRLG